MSMPNAQITQLSSGGTTSALIGLDPLSKMTAVQITVNSTAVGGDGSASTTATFFIQATLDVPYAGSPTPRWASISSAAFVAGVGSSTFVGLNPDGSALLTLLEPVAGLRIFASSGVGAGNIFLRALQSPAA